MRLPLVTVDEGKKDRNDPALGEGVGEEVRPL